jgi:hypothetical protein
VRAKISLIATGAQEPADAGEGALNEEPHVGT